MVSERPGNSDLQTEQKPQSTGPVLRLLHLLVADRKSLGCLKLGFLPVRVLLSVQRACGCTRINAEPSPLAKVARLESSGESGGSIWSSELDHAPLAQRRNWLVKSRPCATGGPPTCVALEGEVEQPVAAVGDALVAKKEDEDCNVQVDSGGVFAGNKCCSKSEKIWECSVDGKSSGAQLVEVHEKNVQGECGTIAFDTSRDATAILLGHTSGATNAVLPSRESDWFGFPDNCLDGEPAKYQYQEKTDSMCSLVRLPFGENQSNTQNNVSGATHGLIVSNSLNSSKVKIEPSDGNDLLNQQIPAVNVSHLLDSEMTLNKRNGEIQDDGWSHELEHVPLLLRRKMLLAGKKVPSVDSPKSAISKVNGSACTSHNDVAFVKEEKQLHPLGISGDDFVKNIVGTTRDEIQSLPLSHGFDSRDMLERGESDICGSAATDASDASVSQCCFGANQISSLPMVFECALSSKLRDFVELQKCVDMTMSKGKVPKSNLCDGQGPGLCPMMITKPSAALKQSAKVKIEPSDHQTMPKSDITSEDYLNLKMLPVKSEAQDSDDLSSDKVDHMLLCERLELLTSRIDSVADTNKTYECYTGLIPSVHESSHPVPESVGLTFPKRLRKRKKTATDSLETALEEDAPGLLKVLLDKGVTVNEIKLYGEAESDELVDESSSNDGFAELEDVISKLFSQRQSFLKFAPLRGSKDAKISYCLACLLSLVEQTRYLRFRKWPAEWGWCRDLQSFIFVFERHNRIVLERPEYGYATYFFELVDSLPIDWQIKRLVIAMKLTSCSRVTLIENKALSVGEDLTEGEAQVLMKYGWLPNTGLGTMLNYCDRVYHDQRNEMDTSDWRAKIGKLLIEGYNGGSIVPTNIRKMTEHQSLMERESLEIARVKMEAEL